MKKEYLYATVLFCVISCTLFYQINNVTTSMDKHSYYCKQSTISNLVKGDLLINFNDISVEYGMFIGKINDSIAVINKGTDPKAINKEDILELLKTGHCFREKKDNCFCEVLWANEIIENPLLFEKKLTLYNISQISTQTSKEKKLLIGRDTVKIKNLGIWVFAGIFLTVFFFFCILFVEKIFSNSKLRKHGIYAGTLLISALLAFDQSNGKSILIFWIGMAKYILILSLIFVIINQLKKRNTFGSKSIKQYLTFTIVIFTVGVVSELISLPVILQLLKSIDSNSYHQYFIENTEKEQFIYWSSFSLAYLIYILLKPLKSKAEEYDKTIKDQISTSSSLASIQSRVNPHFLYNALNSIASLAHTEPQKTEEMALELARFYEKCTDKKADLLIPLRDELSILDSYLKIEKIRFGDRLQVSLPTDEDIMDYLVPSFILQPIVENAIKYGYHSHENFIKIRISASKNTDILTIRIYDRGPLFSENLQSGYGLDSIHKKLKFLFPDRHSISFVNQPEKCVEIVLYQKTNII